MVNTIELGNAFKDFLVVESQCEVPDHEGTDEAEDADVDREEGCDHEHRNQCDEREDLDGGHGRLSGGW